MAIRPASLTAAQPLRLSYAGHALRLQGGQANVILVLPGSWQTSRQSAYSMLTRCVQEVHVFLDTQTQSTGPYHDRDPIEALADRWTTDARKRTASSHLDPAEYQNADQLPTPAGYYSLEPKPETTRDPTTPPHPRATPPSLTGRQFPGSPLVHDLDLSPTEP